MGNILKDSDIFNPASMKILYVDDEEDLREFMTEELEAAAYSVISAENRKKAWELMVDQSVQAVISDARMPQGSGFFLLEKVKSAHPNLPFILILTEGDPSELIDAYHLGAEAIFSKPFPIDEVLARLKNLLLPYSLRIAPFSQALKPPELDLAFASLTDAEEAGDFRLGRCGFFLRVEGVLPRVEQILTFRIRMHDDREFLIEGQAICRWRRGDLPDLPRGAAYEFIELSETSRLLLNAVNDPMPRKAFLPKA